jgi:hypothetical protein
MAIIVYFGSNKSGPKITSKERSKVQASPPVKPSDQSSRPGPLEETAPSDAPPLAAAVAIPVKIGRAGLLLSVSSI